MDDLRYRIKLAESLRERIYRIPRSNREYELLYQPAIQVNHSAVPDTRIILKFTLGFGNYVYPCKMLVEEEGAYVRVGSVGPYFDKLFIRGKADMICSEFIKWMMFARYGTVDGKFAFVFYREKLVGFMVQPENDTYCYTFDREEISAAGLRPEKVFETYSPKKYKGDKVGSIIEGEHYIPIQNYGNGIKPITALKPDFRRTLIWSFLCRQSLMA